MGEEVGVSKHLVKLFQAEYKRRVEACSCHQRFLAEPTYRAEFPCPDCAGIRGLEQELSWHVRHKHMLPGSIKDLAAARYGTVPLVIHWLRVFKLEDDFISWLDNWAHPHKIASFLLDQVYLVEVVTTFMRGKNSANLQP